jgi:hypothetical protein
MFIKPDYNLKDIYEIDLEALKGLGITAILFDLDSTLMGSKTGCYTQKTLEWLEKVKQNFFVGVISNNNNPDYMAKVNACSDFPVVFQAHKPDIKVAQKFMQEHNLLPKTTCFVGDRPLTDVMCGKKLGCTTILVDSITADIEKPIVRFARYLERCTVKH